MQRSKNYRKLINTARWRTLRVAKLSECPFCEICREQGRLTPAVVVHHRQPVESGITVAVMTRLMFAYSNLQALCTECHNKVHIDLRSKSKQVVKQRQQMEAAAAVAKLFPS